MEISRRSFLKALLVTTATPLVSAEQSTMPPPVDPMDAVDLPPVFSELRFHTEIGGLYKDGKLIVAFRSWDVVHHCDYGLSETGRAIRTSLGNWECTAECIIDSTTGIPDVHGDEEYEVHLFRDDIKSVVGTVFIDSYTIHTSIESLITADISMRGINQLEVTR